jgi:malate synthase
MTVVAEGLQPLIDAQAGAGSAVAEQPCDEAGPEPHPEPIAAPISRARFLDHIDSCVRHLAAWLDADNSPDRTPDVAEHSRIQLWQWLHSGDAVLDDGTPIDFALFDAAIQRVGERLPRRGLPGQGNVLRAAWLLAELTYARTLADSLTAAAPARGC